MTVVTLASFLTLLVALKFHVAFTKHAPLKYIPSNAFPGHVIALLPYQTGQISRILSNSHFAVTNTGELITTSDVSHLSGRTFRVSIEHTFANTEWHQTLHLQIRAASEQLQFTGRPYVGHVQENLPRGSIVDGLDTLLENIRNLPFGCKVDVASGDTAAFQIDQWKNRAHLITRSKFDREHKSDYYFVLRVICPQFDAVYAMVQVNINDENDNTPVFSESLYHVTLPRALAATFVNLTRVRAFDADINDSIRYTLDDSSSKFDINAISGDIFTKDNVPLLDKDYELSVIATDGAAHTSSPSLVRIHVTDDTRQKPTASRHKRSVRDERVIVIRKQITGDLFSVVSTPADELERFTFDLRDADGWFDGLRLDTVTGVVSRATGHQWNDDRVSIRCNINVTRNDDSSYLRIQPLVVYPVDRDDYDVIFTNVPRPLWTTVPMWIRPDTTIFTVKSIDAEKYGAQVVYRLESGGDGRFTVHPHTGEVQIVGRKMFTDGDEYELAISAEVNGTIPTLFTLTQVLNVRVEDLKPQFYQSPRYEIDLPENTPNGDSIITIKAKSFQKLPIRYTVHSQDDVPFRLDATSGELTLTRTLYYYQNPHQYRLTVTASEPADLSNLHSETEVLINIIAVNRHAPYFAPDMYMARDVDETIGRDIEIITVEVTDLDLGDNGKVTFNCSDDHFMVTTLDGKKGSLKVNKRLDYDFQAEHKYEFYIIATDGGGKSGRVDVQVFMSNRNDEPPVFNPPEQKIRVKDFSPKAMLVHPVQATDPDGDGLTYRIVKWEPVATATTFPFEINANTGHITLSESAEKSHPNYKLTIEVTDDGSCCQQASQSHTATGYVAIEFIGVNHPPMFTNCPRPVAGGVMVKEGMGNGTSVINITATDDDSGKNGQLEFSLRVPTHITSGRFVVRQTFDPNDPSNTHGVELLTKQEFQREAPFADAYIVNGQVLYRVTIIVTDKGEHPLSSTCFFFVTIDDINNNQPRFDQSEYSTAIMRGSSVGFRVIRVFAIDDDDSDNAVVKYTLLDDGKCDDCFVLDSRSGWLTVNRDLSSQSLRKIFMRVQASDSGHTPQTSEVEVVVELTNDETLLAPQWQLEPGGIMIDDKQISIPENIDLGDELAVSLGVERRTQMSVRPRRSLATGRTIQENRMSDFTMRYDNFFNAYIRVVNTVDFERVQKYFLRLSLTDGGTYSSVARLSVDITDINDCVPLFQGEALTGVHKAAVSDSTKDGDYVLNVHAFDLDGTSPNNKVTYRWNETCIDCQSFRLDKETGRIVAGRSDFRRTVKNQYNLAVVAADGAASVFNTKGEPNTEKAMIWVEVAGTSIHPPYFETKEYEFEIPEAQEFNTTIGTIQAISKDKRYRPPRSIIPDDIIIQHSIISGNEENLFAIELISGRLFIQGITSYNTQQKYDLKIRAFDGGDEDDVATVVIKLTSRNVHAPVFQPYIQTETSLKEGQLPTGGVIAQVKATDPDISQHSLSAIQYSLAGVHADLFNIAPQSGEVSLQQPLSRDYPLGSANWQVNVVATDETGTANERRGYGLLQIQLIDVNSEPPVFDTCCLEGHVKESRIPDTSREVMIVKATDYDSGSNGRIFFELLTTVDGKFRLENMGDGSARIMTTGSFLNRLQKDHYVVTVRAYDGGSPPLEAFQNLTIHIDDIDNNAAFFDRISFSVSVPEMMPVGASVITLTSSDKDQGRNAQRTCTIDGSYQDGRHFTVDSLFTAGTCVIKIKEALDFDGSLKRIYEFRALVRDANPAHSVSTCTVNVNVTDINDNAPVLTPAEKRLELSEILEVGKLVTTFEATDHDSDENALFEFSIDYEHTDPLKQFKVDHLNGEVRLRRPLDRETNTSYAVHVLATDKGTPAQTGTATLLITVTDVNDNAPQLSAGGIGGSYDTFIVTKDHTKGKRIGTLTATDLDSPENGPPFVFKISCNSIECQDFTLDTNPDGTSTSLISSRNGLPPDSNPSSYALTITVSDTPTSGQPSLTSTSAITVRVAGVNAQKPSPGQMSVDVYLLAPSHSADPIRLGTPYVGDADSDDDLKDKTFEFIGSHNEFTLSEKRLMMKSSIRRGTHQLQVSVTDSVWTDTVISTVTVNVLSVDRSVAQSAASVRLKGMTAQTFLAISADTSPCIRFKTTMASLLQTNVSNVHVISVSPGPHDSLHVHFIAHGSPWYRASRLNGLVWTNQDKISQSVGVDVLMSPISGCHTIQCYNGGCTDSIHVQENPVTIEAKRTTFVGIGLETVASCQCASQLITEHCSLGTCLNQGECMNVSSGYKCKCLAGFTGPRCQQLKQSFSGDGWAWYEPLTSCHNMNTSFQFVTTSENALLLYNGPMYDGDATVDYMAVELTSGHVRVRVDLGSGEVVLHVQGDSKLNDGRWHSVQLFQRQQELRLVIDHCHSSEITENIDESTDMRTNCEDTKRVTGEDISLNVNTPLQLGGRSNGQMDRPAQLASGFTGCIKELRHNGMLYDLHIGVQGESERTEDGCPLEAESCETCPKDSICDGSIAGADGRATCVCPPGFKGPQCDQTTAVRDFHASDSYIEWKLTDEFNRTLSKRSFHLQLMFRTRQTDGTIFSADSFSTLERYRLEIVNSGLQFRYDLGRGDSVVRLAAANVSDGVWHTATVHRYGLHVQLSMDNGEAGHYAESDVWIENHRLLTPGRGLVFGGAEVTRKKYVTEPKRDHVFVDSCVSDVRYNHAPFPMAGANDVAKVTASVSTRDTCSSRACHLVMCPSSQSCLDLWRQHLCVCPALQKPAPAPVYCITVIDCSVPRCLHGLCYVTSTSWGCHCDEGWKGRNCSEPRDPEAVVSEATVSSGLIIVIVICLIILLIALLAVVMFFRRRKQTNQLLVVDPDDDIRENVGFYDEEGAGEEDAQGYDLSRLQKPTDNDADSLTKPPLNDIIPQSYAPNQDSAAPRPADSDVGDFIDDRLREANDEGADEDSLRGYANEGADSTAGSLSSIGSSSTDNSDIDFDYLNDFGPRFRRLADLYGDGDGEEENASVV